MSSIFIKKHLPVLLVGLSVILGLIGFSIYFKNQNVSYSFTDLVYSVIRQFLMDSDFTLINVNVILNTARFLAPLSLATAVIQWLLKEFSNRIKLAQVKRLKNHIIVCGNAAFSLSIIFCWPVCFHIFITNPIRFLISPCSK